MFNELAALAALTPNERGDESPLVPLAHELERQCSRVLTDPRPDTNPDTLTLKP